MSSLNNVVLAGNVGTEPERREFESGAKVTKFSMAVSRWNKKDQKEVTDWIDIETFSKLGDYVKKGQKVVVSGSLVTNVYQKEDGTNIKRIYVLANHIELMQQKKDADSNTQNTQTQTQNTQTEDLGCNADYPEDENTNLTEDEGYTADISDLEDEIPF